jgi:transposase InsO family protein
VLLEFATVLSSRVDINLQYHSPIVDINDNQQSINLSQLSHSKRLTIEKPERICEGCIFDKQHRESFPVGKSYREKSPLEIVHLDIFGTMQTPSIGGSTYFLTFIDDFSRKTWIYFLKHKSDALGYFQQFKSLVEKHSGYYIKCLRTDRGGEYISREFQNFCKFHGIYKKFTA